MECKDVVYPESAPTDWIRIVPEWNVKNENAVLCRLRHNIRIVPEWNVKFNIPSFSGTIYIIRIVPEWNVKKYVVVYVMPTAED